MWSCNFGYPFAGGSWFWGQGIIGFLFTVLLASLVIYCVVLAVRAVFSSNDVNRDQRDSLEILRVKFARGEISEQEYVRMKDILQS